MPQFLELVIIAFLVLISVELLLIHRDLMRTQGRGVVHGDETQGQTINVNVGSPGGVAAVPVTTTQERIEENKDDKPVAIEATDAESSSSGASGASGADDSPPEPRPQRVPFDPGYRATSSGLIAKKCPSCGSENSSYRSECFNCGSSL